MQWITGQWRAKLFFSYKNKTVVVKRRHLIHPDMNSTLYYEIFLTHMPLTLTRNILKAYMQKKDVAANHTLDTHAVLEASV